MSDSPEAKAGESGVDSLRAKAKLRGLLGSALRVTLSDGRAVTGRYQCMDEHLNVILREASERRGMGARAGVGGPRAGERAGAATGAGDAPGEARGAGGGEGAGPPGGDGPGHVSGRGLEGWWDIAK
jgi:small nuclear ribonucleoprotein (snRNP)-like protein